MPTNSAARRAGHLVVFAIIWCLSSAASAWWDLGHHSICELALEKVSPATRGEIERLLSIDAPEKYLAPESFGASCTWADRIKGKYKSSRPWHYLNVPQQFTDVTKVPRPEGGDILSALETFSRVFSDTRQSDTDRAEALRFIGHFLGDLHQPMHLGRKADRGGNRIKMDLSPGIAMILGEKKRRATNLHVVWDGYSLLYAKKTGDASLKKLITESNARTTEGDVLSWANDTLTVLRQDAAHYNDLDNDTSALTNLTEAYLSAITPIALEQVATAAYRLAALLDSLLLDPLLTGSLHQQPLLMHTRRQ